MNAAPRDHRDTRTLSQQLRSAWPYLLLELLLPGGTLFALLLFVYRNRPLAGLRLQALQAPAIVAQVITRAKALKPLPQRMLLMACGPARCGTCDHLLIATS